MRLPRPTSSSPVWRPAWRKVRSIWLRALAQNRTWTWRTLLDPAAFWQTLGSWESEPLRFDDWQVLWLWDRSRYRATEKSPQIGWSWVCAAEALHRCLIFEDDASGFVSVSQREAGNKILYARKLYDGLPDVVKDWVPMVYDSTEELAFGDRARPALLMSFAATSSLRGRMMHVYLDEVDFYRDGGREAFRIGLGRTTRGTTMAMGSTCFGAETMLDEIMHGGSKQHFSTAVLPYLVAENPEILDSIALARDLLAPEDFDEEYGCRRGGGGVESFPAELIRKHTHDRMEPPVDDDGIPSLPAGAPTVLGLDVGGSRHPSVLNVWQREKRDGPWIQMAVIEWRTMPLAEQEGVIRRILQAFPEAVAGIDANGLGLQAAQTLEAEFGSSRVVGIIPGSKPSGLPPQTKGDMATALKRALESSEVELLQDREQMTQFNRTRIHSGGLVEQKGSRKRSHFDRFWSAAYARYAAGVGGVQSVYETRGLQSVGGDKRHVEGGGATRVRALMASEAEARIMKGRLVITTSTEWAEMRQALEELADRWTQEGQLPYAGIARREIERLGKLYGEELEEAPA